MAECSYFHDARVSTILKIYFTIKHLLNLLSYLSFSQRAILLCMCFNLMSLQYEIVFCLSIFLSMSKFFAIITEKTAQYLDKHDFAVIILILYSFTWQLQQKR